MDAWEELSSKFSAAPDARFSAGDPVKSQPNEWDALSRRHASPSISGTRQPVPFDAKQLVAEQMPWYERAAAQLGSGFADAAQSVRQLAGQSTQADVDAKRKLDAPLLRAGAGGGALNLTGDILPSLAIPAGVVTGTIAKFGSKIPALSKFAPIAEGATQGGIASGVFQPVGTGESRAFNAGMGALGGALVPSVAASYRGAVGSASPEASQLAQTAINKYGIPLQASDLTDSRVLKAINSIASDLPLSGGIAAGRTDAKNRAFNSAVGKEFGAAGDRLTPEVTATAKKGITDKFNKVYSNNPADVFMIQQEIAPVLQRVAREGTNDQQRIIESRLQDLNSRIDPQTGLIDGNYFNRWQSDIGSSFKNDDLISSFRKHALSGYNKSITGEDAKLLSEARSQYRNYKIVEPLLDKASLGNINPALLQARVAQETSDFATGGGGNLAELGRIGRQFMVDRTPQTGGSIRAAMQNGAMVAGAGVGGAVGGFGGAAAGAAVPSAVMGVMNGVMNNNYARNSIMREALSSPKVQRGLLDFRPDGSEMLAETFRRSGQVLPGASFGGLLGF